MIIAIDITSCILMWRNLKIINRCKFLKIDRVPRIVPLAVEDDDPEGPFGAKGVGEIVCIPTAPAVANAFFSFDGIRRYRLPLVGGTFYSPYVK
jgi:CO/xanthine dehydrogenase Mo-binding subunit